LWCWGINLQGQTGQGSGASPVVPTQVGGASWVAIGSSADHSCAVRADQTMWCWGKNRFGDLGYPGAGAYTPTQVGADDNWMDVASFDATTCARKFGDTMLCWGADDVGQLGDGSPTPQRKPVPVMIVPA
jgi:alpha-tubulin suppressor-like RCC1 family protein